MLKGNGLLYTYWVNTSKIKEKRQGYVYALLRGNQKEGFKAGERLNQESTAVLVEAEVALGWLNRSQPSRQGQVCLRQGHCGSTEARRIRLLTRGALTRGTNCGFGASWACARCGLEGRRPGRLGCQGAEGEQGARPPGDLAQRPCRKTGTSSSECLSRYARALT